MRLDTVLCINEEGAPGAGSSSEWRSPDSGSVVDLDSTAPWVTVDWTAGSAEYGATDVGESANDGVVLGSPKKTKRRSDSRKKSSYGKSSSKDRQERFERQLVSISKK